MPAKATKKLPVYVFIHGGGYNYGFSEIFHNPTMASIFIPNNIILVTFNYRLTHFGFFAWPDKHFPKNLGLWDQNAALRFVKENIEAFGGNPDDITIGGHSAGAASVHAHTISPHSRHLFHKAIEMAGNLASVWSIGDETYHFSEILAKELGCDKCDGEKTKKCLQKLAVEDFWAAKQKLGFVATKPTMNNIYWKPVWDEDFFDGKTMEELTAESPPKPILYGLDAGEAVVFTLNTGNPIASFITDVGFIVPLVNEYRSKLKHGFESQFLYIFNFTREKDQPILGMKPPHGSELLFLNGINAYTHDQIKEFKADELRVQRTIGQSLVNFIKTGNPSIPGIQVPELTTRSISFFEIGKKSKVQENFYEPIVQFWENASEKYEFDVITGKPYHSNHFRDEV
uniref:Carboxylic ester hydrolase n=1 Tax=Panagrolaimus sp. JU765 TaxID=591449 RepID=A0AC34Q6I3_9BILA